MKLTALKRGSHGDAVRAFQQSMNARLKARDLDAYVVAVDGEVGPRTLRSARKAAWALGALSSTYNAIVKNGVIPVGVFRLVRNPGKRTPEQLARARARMSHLRAARKRRHEQAAKASSKRLLVVHKCLLAAAHYRANPGAYHYLAGGVANLIYLQPSPRSYRSDCSQFASAVQHDAGLPDLGPNGPLWVNTDVMDQHLEVTEHPLPGDFGMYGRHHGGTHHVEVYLGAAGGPGHEFVGHGSPPIDSLTPGRPDFYLRNPVGN